MEPSKQDWLPVAKLLRPQGRRGEILAEPLADTTLLSPGKQLSLSPSEETRPQPGSEQLLEDAWTPTGRNAGRVVLKLRGVNSISEAEALEGKYLLLPSSELPALDADTFFVRDLVGCSLYDGKQLAGTIVDIQFPVGPDGRTRLADAPDLLAVEPPSAPGGEDAPEPALIPFVRAWLESVDLAARRITMHLPPGLFDTLNEG